MHTTTTKPEIAARIDAFRGALADHSLDAWIFPSNDPHQSEYVADHWKAREWISGFTGSAGLVVLTGQKTSLWTDSRYFLQAETELAGTGIELQRAGEKGVLNHHEWLKQQLPEGARVGIDGKLLSVQDREAIEKAFAAKGIKLVTEEDLVAVTWKDRPPLPLTPVEDHDVSLAGQAREEKIAAVRQVLKDEWYDHHLLSTLDDIAWLFNLRGADVEYNPIFYAYALISWKSATLFVEPAKIPQAPLAQLAAAGVDIQPYDAMADALGALKGKVMFEPAKTSVTAAGWLGAEAKAVHAAAPSTLLKSKKNATEIAHVRNAMARDGVALLRLYRWLESEIGSGVVTEADVSDKLAEFRSLQEGYRGESFGAIAGYKGNGAIVHYRPEHGKSATLAPEGMFLLDSGGQYVDGTTDITRTISLSPPSAEQKRDYTLVLKGHIGLGQARFPVGTRGYHLDTFARMHLWQHGLNYGHGTGHGVGFFLNVHEGPQSIRGTHTGMALTVFEPGMITSNEPGFYKAGEYGIRIENLVLCVEAGETDYGKFLAFENLTMFPIDTALIDRALLLESERQWLNTYHSQVWEALSPGLEADELAWLKAKCAGI